MSVSSSPRIDETCRTISNQRFADDINLLHDSTSDQTRVIELVVQYAGHEADQRPNHCQDDKADVISSQHKSQVNASKYHVAGHSRGVKALHHYYSLVTSNVPIYHSKHVFNTVYIIIELLHIMSSREQSLPHISCWF